MTAASAALAFAGCGDEDSAQSASRPAQQPVAESPAPAGDTGAASAAASASGGQAQAARRGTTIKVMRTQFGRIIVNGRGRAIYLFTRERGSTPRCYGACARAWPPVYTRGRPRARGGARQGLLGTTARRGGRRQVTYDGQPLYYYVDDREPGQVLCQNVVEFGGTWLVLRSNGRAVR